MKSAASQPASQPFGGHYRSVCGIGEGECRCSVRGKLVVIVDHTIRHGAGECQDMTVCEHRAPNHDALLPS